MAIQCARRSAMCRMCSPSSCVSSSACTIIHPRKRIIWSSFDFVVVPSPLFASTKHTHSHNGSQPSSVESLRQHPCPHAICDGSNSVAAWWRGVLGGRSADEDREVSWNTHTHTHTLHSCTGTFIFSFNRCIGCYKAVKPLRMNAGGPRRAPCT